VLLNSQTSQFYKEQNDELDQGVGATARAGAERVGMSVELSISCGLSGIFDKQNESPDNLCWFNTAMR